MFLYFSLFTLVIIQHNHWTWIMDIVFSVNINYSISYYYYYYYYYIVTYTIPTYISYTSIIHNTILYCKGILL